MSTKYRAYEMKLGEVESRDSEGRPTSQKAELVMISTKTHLKELVKDSPALIFLNPIPNISYEPAYKGPLVTAPKNKSYIIEGRKKAAPATNSFSRMMQMEYGQEVYAYSATITWSERTKKWRVSV